MDIEDYDWDRLSGIYPAEFVEKMKGLDGKACWKGYKLSGTQKKGGKTVDNCVEIKKTSNHNEGDVATAEMTPNFLPKEPIPGGGDKKNLEMAEHKMLMPRMEDIEKKNARDGHLSQASAPDYAEFDSDENNGAMIVNQLRVIREKTDILLGMLDGTDNLPPWCFVKITNAGTGLASVADYLRYGTET
jgi:hypothetical protein